MQNLHFKLTSKYPKYNNWHQAKHHNKIHWGVLVVFALIVFALILNSTNQINAQADITPPSIPANLTASAVSSSQINLSWNASTDNIGVTGYKIYRCTGLTCTPTTQIGTSATNSFSDTGLTASTTYTYTVSAYDAAGNESGKSTSVSATTLTTSTGNTYYISPVGNDTTGNGSNTSPWATLSKAFGQMQGGDILIIRDGVYKGVLNSIDNVGFNRPTVIPPNGTEGNYTVIHAENEGQVTFDGEGVRSMFNLTAGTQIPQYIEFRGIKWIDSGDNTVVFIANAHHIKIFRSGAGDSTTNSSSALPFYISKSSYILLEDVYAWGAGRYKFEFFVSDHIICRRCAARTDATTGISGIIPSVIAVFQNYCSQFVEYQNSIAIDTDTPQYLTQWYELQGGFTSHPYCDYFNEYSENTSYRGSIALNNKIDGSGIFTNSSRNFYFTDFVGWDTVKGLWGGTPVAPDNYIIDHSLLGNMKGNYYNHGIYDFNGNTVVTNSIFYGNDGNGLRTIASSNYNSLYANGSDYSNVSPGLKDLSAANGNAIDPIDGTPGNGIPALKYLLRVENGSDLDGRASDGGDIGPTILKKIGVSGTLYGELGYNTITNEDLWPWPIEDQIKKAFASYNPGGTDTTKPDGKRGFAADGTGLYGGPITLTSYIWEYLGNPCPAEICVALPDNTAPLTPTNLAVTLIFSSQINLSWTASTDDVGVTGYKIYRCSGSSCAPTTQIATSATNSYSDTGLTASTTYTYAVSAYDAAGNESGKSGAMSVATFSQFKPSDLNQDQKVDQLDFDILKQDWKRTDKPKSDLNQDGIVDTRDLGIMMSSWEN